MNAEHIEKALREAMEPLIKDQAKNILRMGTAYAETHHLKPDDIFADISVDIKTKTRFVQKPDICKSTPTSPPSLN